MKRVFLICSLIFACGCMSEQALQTHKLGRQIEFNSAIDKKIVSITEVTSNLDPSSVYSTVIFLEDGTKISIKSQHSYEFVVRKQEQ